VGGAFALYVMFMIRRAMASPPQPAAKAATAAKPPAAAQPKTAPLVPAEKTD
jgi:hypothetical protein